MGGPEFAKRVVVEHPEPNRTPDLGPQLFGAPRLRQLHRVPLVFDPPGLRDSPFVEYPECSPVSAYLQAQYPWLPACQLETEAERAGGIAAELRLLRVFENPLIETGTSNAPLSVVKREPRSHSPPQQSLETSRRSWTPAENAARRDELLTYRQALRGAEQAPNSYVHVIEGFPIVEVRTLGKPTAWMYVWDRGGLQPIFQHEFPVQVNRLAMNPDHKNRFRHENISEMRRIIEANWTRLDQLDHPGP